MTRTLFFFKTFGAVSYEKATDMVKSAQVDLIIAEITNRPDGLAPLESLAATEGIPFFIAHFHVQPPNEQISLPVIGYIWKPFDRLQLLNFGCIEYPGFNPVPVGHTCSFRFLPF